MHDNRFTSIIPKHGFIPQLLVPLVAAVALAGAALSVGLGGVAAAGDRGQPVEVNCEQNVCLVLVDASSDSDGDGFTDIDEKFYGTDPLDAASHPNVLEAMGDIADGVLPGYWLEPHVEIVTVMPDGHAITSDLDALQAFGLLPSTKGREAKLGITKFPEGFDLGSVGSLNWNIHANDNAAPPPGKDTSLYADGAGPKHGKGGGKQIEWGPWVSLGATGSYTASGGTEMMSGSERHGSDGSYEIGTHTDVITKTGEKVSDTMVGEHRSPDGNSSRVEVRSNADGVTTKVSSNGIVMYNTTVAEDGTTTDNMTKEEKAEAKAEQDRLDAEAKAKSEKEAADKKKKDGGYYDADAVGTSSNPFDGMSAYEVVRAVRAATGGNITNTGDNGISPSEVSEGGYVPAGEEIIHADPDAGTIDPTIPSGTPGGYNHGGPEVDPNHGPGANGPNGTSPHG